MFNKLQLIIGISIGAALVIGAFFAYSSHAQPGSDTDPVISLSYLETALAVSPITLEGGEDFRVVPGRGIILIEGSCRLSMPSEGRSWILDTTEGTVYTEPVEMTIGHLYIPLSDDNESAIFTVIAWRTSTLAIPGSTGR